MRLKLTLVLGIAVAGVVVLVLPAWAHHAHGNYTTETKDFEGIVTEYHLLNPHSFVYVKVTDADGKSQIWAMEGGGGRDGKGALKPGDKVKARCHPLRDGSPGCLLGFIKGPDGIVRDFDAGGREVKVDGF